MNTILKLFLVLGALVAQAQGQRATVTRDVLCERPDFGGSDTSRSALTWRWQRTSGRIYAKDYNPSLLHDFTLSADLKLIGKNSIVIGQFDQTQRDVACVGKPYDLYTDNEQEIALELVKPPNTVCSVLPIYTDNPSRDYGALIQSLFTNVIGKVLGYESGIEFVAIILPSAGIKNTVASVTISCKEGPGKDAKTVGTDRKINIHYGNLDLFTASAGAIVSTLGKRLYGIKTTTDGKNADGTDKTLSTIAITSSSNAQFVPIALINLNYAGNRKVSFNGQLGLGINPNGSSTQVEYFASPVALGWKGLYLAAGLHVARSERLGGGFALGDTVSSSNFSAPTLWQATYKFGFTVSYQPLPKK